MWTFQAEDGTWHTRDLCAEYCTTNNGGKGSARSFRSEQTQRRKEWTVDVHRRINDEPWKFFHGPPKVCKDGELKHEEMPAWTRKAIARVWQEVLKDVEASHAYPKNVMRHVVREDKKGEVPLCSHVSMSTASCSQ